MKAIKKFYSDGRVEEGRWEMSLEQMQEFVGGYIEMRKSTIPGFQLIMNEEGFLRRLQPNLTAHALLHSAYAVEVVRGNVLLVEAK